MSVVIEAIAARPVRSTMRKTDLSLGSSKQPDV